MRVACLADLHGSLPKKVPESDLIVIAGDICPDLDGYKDQADWLNKVFRDWLDEQKAKVVACWGNHDFIGEKPHLVPEGLNWDIVHGSHLTYKGRKIFGAPWTTGFKNWALQVTSQHLDMMFDMLEPCNILLSHTPPYTVGDKLSSNGGNVGSKGLLKYLARQGSPALTVTGHIHEGRGISILPDGGVVCNASFVDYNYKPYPKEIPVFDIL
jgi:Icc-related predicted phosphoesterase